MLIYLYHNHTKKTQSITASRELAEMIALKALSRGDKVAVYEGTIKTQGKNFYSWASNWKEIEIELPF